MYINICNSIWLEASLDSALLFNQVVLHSSVFERVQHFHIINLKQVHFKNTFVFRPRSIHQQKSHGAASICCFLSLWTHFLMLISWGYSGHIVVVVSYIVMWMCSKKSMNLKRKCNGKETRPKKSWRERNMMDGWWDVISTTSALWGKKHNNSSEQSWGDWWNPVITSVSSAISHCCCFIQSLNQEYPPKGKKNWMCECV